MKLAIKEAEKSKEPLKCGVVIVKDGEVVSKAFNTQRTDNNATAHAEVNAITLAGKQLRYKNLEGCVVYGTCEPCTMCLSAMIFARIDKLAYGLSLREVSSEIIDIDIDTFLNKSPYRFEVVKNYMEDECRKLL